MTRRLRAATFHRFMTSGRTTPVLLACEDEWGNAAGDYVVKLRGGMETGQRGLLCELVASELASYFGLKRPEPAVVMLDQGFAELVILVEPNAARRLRESIGMNFGSRHLTDVTIWPIGRPMPDAMMKAAVEVFAFDCLIDNYDRRFNNPNLLARGDEVFVFDHEVAFSFLYAVTKNSKPWQVTNRVLREHVFYLNLKGKDLELDQFVARLANLGEAELRGLAGQIPEEWRTEDLSRISARLTVIRDHALEFMEEIRRGLV